MVVKSGLTQQLIVKTPTTKQITLSPTPKPTPYRKLMRLYEDSCVQIKVSDYVFCDKNPPKPGENERIYFDSEGNYYSTTINSEGQESEYRLIPQEKTKRDLAWEEIARRCNTSSGCHWKRYSCYCSYPDGSFTMISYL
jgi:hypothetical protein